VSRHRSVRDFLYAWPLLLQAILAFPDAVQAEVLTRTNEWEVLLPALSDSCPAVGSDGTLYFGTFTGDLFALRPDGTKKWSFSAGREIHCSPAIGVDGTIYFGSRNRKFYAVRSNGQEAWEFKTGGWVDTSPAIGADGTVYFGSWDKSFYALSPEGIK
jgi:outer membrane protein assembly factor BamB